MFGEFVPEIGILYKISAYYGNWYVAGGHDITGKRNELSAEPI